MTAPEQLAKIRSKLQDVLHREYVTYAVEIALKEVERELEELAIKLEKRK